MMMMHPHRNRTHVRMCASPQKAARPGRRQQRMLRRAADAETQQRTVNGRYTTRRDVRRRRDHNEREKIIILSSERHSSSTSTFIMGQHSIASTHAQNKRIRCIASHTHAQRTFISRKQSSSSIRPAYSYVVYISILLLPSVVGHRMKSRWSFVRISGARARWLSPCLSLSLRRSFLVAVLRFRGNAAKRQRKAEVN